MIKKIINSLRHVSRVNYHYTGSPVGLKTSGNYKDLPKPAPGLFAFTQGPVDAFMTSVWGLWSLITLSAWFGPIFFLPFWLPHKRALRDAAENYGPIRYGKSIPDIA